MSNLKVDVLELICDEEENMTLTQIADRIEDDYRESEENIALSQIADELEKDYRDCETLEFDRPDFQLDLHFEAETVDTDAGSMKGDELGLMDRSMDITSKNSVMSERELGNPVQDEDLNNLISETIPANTKKSTNWAVNVFTQWRKSRNANDLEKSVPELNQFTTDDINMWFFRFIVEVRKQDGDFYPPESLYLLSSGLLRNMRNIGNTEHFMNENDDRFLRFRRTVDAQMKLLTSKGYGSTLRHAEPISKEQEAQFWNCEVIGYDTAESLHVVFFYNCKLFGMERATVISLNRAMVELEKLYHSL